MGMDYRHAVLATDPKVWGTLSKSERVSVLQALEDHAADWNGRSPRTVTPQLISSEQGSHNFGYYDHYHNPDKLFLNEQDLDDINETLDTLFHEGQHAYQHDCVDGKINIPEPIRQQFDDAFKNYVSLEQDPRAYANNFAERDARKEAQVALMRLENERTIFQENHHDIEIASDVLKTPPEHNETYARVASDNIGHEVASKTEPSIPWSEEASLRKKAVDGAWEREKEFVQNGHGTREWTVEQQAELLREGHVTGFEGSHMMSVKDYPEYAGKPENIQFLPSVAHFEGVHQGDPVRIHPNGRFDENTGEVISAKDGQIPEQPVIALSDKYDPSQEEYHRSTPEMGQSGLKRHEDYYCSKENHPEKSQRIGFRAPPEEEHNEEIAHTEPEDQIESTHAEKTPEEFLNSHEEATEEKLSAEAPNTPKQVTLQDDQVSERTDEVSMTDQESAAELNPYTPTNDASRTSNDQDNKTSERVTEAPAPPSEQARSQPEQNDDHLNFWSTVSSNTASSDSQSNNQENAESNTISM